MHGFYRILSAKVQILFQNSAKMQTNYLFFISYSYITDFLYSIISSIFACFKAINESR